MSSDKKAVVVLGAGVIGLTTALHLQETNRYNVTIVAETLPTDPKTITYTSQWAGAHHVSLSGKDVRQQKMDKVTFDKFWELSAPGGLAENCFLRLPQTEYYMEERSDPHFPYPEFREVSKDLLPEKIHSAVTFKTVTIDSPVYLNWLLSTFLSKGGSIVRGTVQHISQVVEGGPGIFQDQKRVSVKPDAVIVAVGLGARSLGGVEDKTMYPIRGQTVVVRAPWVRFGRTISSMTGLWTYIIPRRSGDVILGGIKESDDWYPNARPEGTRDILERAFSLCPELAPPGTKDPTIQDVLPLVIEEGCGHRPGRKDGIRLETEWFEEVKGGRNIPIVHNYGHGGYGYQSSWGSAELALGLLDEALERRP
ncbi:D-amino-acid oxidase [Flagelloscypha sp. PMI_526]|nr:D-amino-acid oxidase [Flagelloscypha sp. PMI_526]